MRWHGETPVHDALPARERRRRRLAIALVFGLVVVIAATFGLARRGEASSPAPGLTAGVAAMNALPVHSGALPPTVSRFVETAAHARDTDPAAALSRVRLLRGELGTSARAVYAFKTSTGSICFIVTGGAGVCPRTVREGTPGLLWTIGGGTEQDPSSFTGIASDEVASLVLTVDGKAILTSIDNNVAYAEFPAVSRDAVIAIERTAGSETKVDVHLQG